MDQVSRALPTSLENSGEFFGHGTLASIRPKPMEMCKNWQQSLFLHIFPTAYHPRHPGFHPEIEVWDFLLDPQKNIPDQNTKTRGENHLDSI